ncbi:MAG: MBL fold metallo-hydrolase [Clostridia bacterium]|nr:MBL fold metallo-hydrolase [Clostridia bacterium]
MGYRAEKLKAERKMRVVKTVTACIVLVAILSLCVVSAFIPPKTWKYHVGKPKIDKRNTGELRVHFIDVGQGDSALIEFPDGKVALVDGGDESGTSAEAVLRFMNALKIKKIDYLIASHADADHCGALDAVLECKEVFNAYLPAVNVEKSGQAYKEFYQELLEENCSKVYSSREISLSNRNCATPYTFEFIYPYSIYADEEYAEENTATDNNRLSSVLWLDYMGVSVLLTGDAPFATEVDLMADDKLGVFNAKGVHLSNTEILKIAHHGSKDSTSLEFLKYLNAETAIISCGKNNLYGHPSDAVCENLKTLGVKTYRTDECGTVTVTIAANGKYSVS